MVTKRSCFQTMVFIGLHSGLFLAERGSARGARHPHSGIFEHDALAPLFGSRQKQENARHFHRDHVKGKRHRCSLVFNVFGDKTVFVRLHLISSFRLSTKPTARPSASWNFTPQATFNSTRRSTYSSIVTLRTFLEVHASFHGSRRQEPSCVQPPFRRQLLRCAPRLTAPLRLHSVRHLHQAPASADGILRLR